VASTRHPGHVLDFAAHRQPVLGQADSPAPQIGLNRFVLNAVKAVLIEQRGQL
jgi:hypothetical protein